VSKFDNILAVLTQYTCVTDDGRTDKIAVEYSVRNSVIDCNVYVFNVLTAYCSAPGTLDDVCSLLNHKSAYYTLVKGN